MGTESSPLEESCPLPSPSPSCWLPWWLPTPPISTASRPTSTTTTARWSTTTAGSSRDAPWWTRWSTRTCVSPTPRGSASPSLRRSAGPSPLGTVPASSRPSRTGGGAVRYDRGGVPGTALHRHEGAPLRHQLRHHSEQQVRLPVHRPGDHHLPGQDGHHHGRHLQGHLRLRLPEEEGRRPGDGGLWHVHLLREDPQEALLRDPQTGEDRSLPARPQPVLPEGDQRAPRARAEAELPLRAQEGVRAAEAHE